jgi:hypothetical protein
MVLQTTVSVGTGILVRDVEFIIHRSDDPVSTYYAYSVEGRGSAHWSPTTSSITTTVSGSVYSTFSGSRESTLANPTDIVISHNTHTAASDTRHTVRVYKRKKV